MTRRQRYTWTNGPRPVHPDEQPRPPRKTYPGNQLALAIILSAFGGWVAHEIYTISVIFDALGL